jgi:hypothetical protein
VETFVSQYNMRYEAVVTHIPVIKVPITPARAWTAKTSMGSSTRIETFNLVAKFEQNEATKPIRAAAGAPTKPAAGVIATKLRGTRHQISNYRTNRMKKKTYPAMAPVQKPTTLHLRSRRKSMIIQTIPLEHSRMSKNN